MREGDRARVDLTSTREQWNQGAADVLHGAVGIVERVVQDHGIAPPRPAALVKFDPPLPKTWSNGSPVVAHWFDLPELHEVAS